MPTPRISKLSPDALYFCTCTVLEWLDIFTKPIYFVLLIESLKYCQKNKGLNLYGYVLMTNHLHLIFSAQKGYKPEDILRDFKKWTTKSISGELNSDSRLYVKNLLAHSVFKKKENAMQIWQPNNYSEMIETKDFLLQKLKYIHMNPVRRGFVAESKDWKYSSARNWEIGDNSVIEVITTELW
jgi:REP element-mobilizing transposase RayT